MGLRYLSIANEARWDDLDKQCGPNTLSSNICSACRKPLYQVIYKNKFDCDDHIKDTAINGLLINIPIFYCKECHNFFTDDYFFDDLVKGLYRSFEKTLDGFLKYNGHYRKRKALTKEYLTIIFNDPQEYFSLVEKEIQGKEQEKLKKDEDERKKEQESLYRKIECKEITGPEWGSNDIVIDEKIKEQINDRIQLIEHKEHIFGKLLNGKFDEHKDKNFINLYGPPGTGKTMIAKSIAKKMGRAIFLVNYAQLESSKVGQT